MKKALRPGFGGTLAIAAVALALIGIVGLPLAVVAIQAFAGGFAPIARTLSDGDTLHAILLTLEVAAATVAINTAIGLIVAWTLTKYRFAGKSILSTLIDLPLSVSPVVAGLAVLLTFGPHSPVGAWLAAHGLKVIFSTPGIIFATVFVTFPFIARETAAVMDEQGRVLEEAALTTGASVWDVFWRVTLPNARIGVINGIVLCTARALGEFGAVSVVSGRIRGQTETISLHIEALYNDYNLHGAFALSLVLALISFAAILARQKWARAPHG